MTLKSEVTSSQRVDRLQRRRKQVSDERAAIATHAVGYIRVSSEEQAAHGHGLKLQEKAIRAFAQSQGYELVDVVADPGVSGAKRPADRRDHQFERTQARRAGAEERMAAAQAKRDRRNAKRAAIAAKSIEP